MREIKFRAKMLDSDDFVYGYYINSELPSEIFKHKIYCSDVNRLADVKEETVGQYTGLKDKNGKEIYEGDILKYTFDGKEKIDYIEYQGNMFTYHNAIRWSLHYDEVIGNIYDNPELLKEE